MTAAGPGVLITGGTSGIGLAIARRFAADGATVAVLGRSAERARAVGGPLGLGSIGADVTDPAAVKVAVEEAVTALGTLNILVTAAGAAQTRRLLDTSNDDWARLIGVNLSGVFYALKAAGPHLQAAAAESGMAAVVNVASISGVRPAAGEGPYAAAKAGVLALTSAAALELAPAVRVNAVSPGPVATPMLQPYLDRFPDEADRFSTQTPIGRTVTAEEVADAVHWLCCGSGSAAVTGQNLLIDGGLTLHGSSADGMLARLENLS